MCWSTKFNPNMVICLQMHQNWLINQMPRKGKYATEHNQKLIRLWEAQGACIHQIWDQFHEHFVRKCTQTTNGDGQTAGPTDKPIAIVPIGREQQCMPLKLMYR